MTMTWGNWVLVVFLAAFFLAMLIGLAGFFYRMIVSGLGTRKRKRRR